MRKNKRAILVGSQNLGDKPDDGETMKNHLIGLQLEKNGIEVSRIDLRHRPARLLYLVKYLYELIFHRDSTIVMSSSPFVAEKMLRIAKLLGWKGEKIVYWVVGGSFGEIIESKRLDVNLYKDISHILVQGQGMVKRLNANGLYNVEYLPNCKPINFVPYKKNETHDMVRFVFLSRVMSEKGVEYIFEAARQLRNEGKDNFIVDLYGKVDKKYEEKLNDELNITPNAKYKGFLKLTDRNGYETLSTYDIMLFPTYWHGEGFPGILIDAFIAGLPVIATDWNLNTDLIKDDYNGMIIPVHDVNALAGAMRKVIDGEIDVKKMSENTQGDAKKYDVENVITVDLLRRLRIL